MKKITCMLVDDEPASLERLEQILANFPQIKIIEKVLIPEKAVTLILQERPDLVFVDIEMPRMSGFEVVKKVREANAFTVFVFVTAFSQYAIKAIKESIFDYVLKPYDIDEIKSCIQKYETRRSTSVDRSTLSPILDQLSSREKDILKLILQCKTSQDIAEELFISKHTVDTHRRNILKKTSIKSFAEFFHLLYQ